MKKRIYWPNLKRGSAVIVPAYPWICRICNTYKCEFPCPFLTPESFFSWEKYWEWWFNTTPAYDWKKRISL